MKNEKRKVLPVRRLKLINIMRGPVQLDLINS